MVVQHNISSMNANRYYNINNSGLAKSLEKLSSGFQINRAGDNAAGLAVSEKMRSQIGGLTQGVKNAQDGISMIQTYEGALTETDSILQRMKTLADQAANGTYQDDVDREAIQLEFDQLNDELDQIADTDFNGVVMLNGGQMADGLKAVDTKGAIVDGNTGAAVSGSFNYNNKKGQVIEKATTMAQESVDTAYAALEKAKAALTKENFDLSANGHATEWNTVDDTAFDKTAADTLWKAAGFSKNAGADADTSTVNTINVTYTLGDDGKTWTATSAVTNTGATVASDKLSAFGSGTTKTATGATGLGGVSFTVGGASVNSIFDATQAKAGDTITLTYTNADSAKKAPTNVGFKDDSYDDSGLTAGSVTTKPAATLGALTDANMTQVVADTVNALDGQKVEYTAAAGALTGATINGETINDGVITLKDTNGNALKDTAGNDIKVHAKYDAGKITLSTVAADGTSAGIKIMDISAPAVTATTTAGKFSAKLSVDVADYKDAALKPNVKAGKSDTLNTSNAVQEAYKKAEEDYNAAVEAQGKLNDFEAAKAYLAEAGVSVSDSYDQSTTTLTYTNNLTLQAGARTKDSVQFTFKYDSKGLGELEPNMDCSSREGGLGTSKLSLRTQKDANNAIDKIDNAINKVSMVRATFGATQNRLEHKIDNMNVTKENITSAESRIRDTDVSEEMANFTKNQILSQASQSMLAQANSLPQNVLQLLG